MTETILTLPANTTGGYEMARFNALRHGVLSRYTVLPWEDAEEYRALVAALAGEHAPQGPTEEHLVEELAGIWWRKRGSSASPNVIRFAKSAREEVYAGRRLLVIRDRAEAAVSDTTPMPCPHGGSMADGGGRSPTRVFRTPDGHEGGAPQAIIGAPG